MLEYPIYKHLIQFSNLVDKNGVLITDQPNGVQPGLVAQTAKPLNTVGDGVVTAVEENKNEAEEQHEGGETDLAYEGGGGDTQTS